MHMVIQLVTCSLLAIWLIYRVFKLWRLPLATGNKFPEPPVHDSRIPFVGHLLGIAFQGSNSYISSLCAAQHSPISTLRLPGQDIHLVHPLDSSSIKQFTRMHTMSLMTVFRVAIGPSMGLVSASERFLSDPDSGVFKRALSKLFNEELRSLQTLRRHAAQLEQRIGEYWDETTKGRDPVRVGLGSWIFDLLSRSMGAVFWGREGPFEDDLFREYLRLFIQNLETLRNPISFFVPRELRIAREYVRKKLDQSVEDKAYGDRNQEPTLFRRLSLLYETLQVPQEGFTDCHLVAIVGLMSNVINMITWAISHIVAEPELMACLLAEINAGVNESHSPNTRGMESLVLDIDRVRSSCPLLLATWYELLRIYGDSPVARSVQEDGLFDAKYQIRKGSIIMTPIHLRNFCRDIWGLDANTFRPSRFLKDDGKVDTDLVKYLNVFGLPGMHQCPGRYLGLNITLAIVAKVLLSFDISPTSGDALGRGIVPKRKETMLGLPAMSRDPEVVVRQREGIESVHVTFENVQPGW